MSGRDAVHLGHVFSFAVIDRYLGTGARLAEFGGQLSGFGDGAWRRRFALRVAEHHMRARVIRRVKPEVVRFRDAEGEVIVVLAAAPDQNLVAVTRSVTAHARNLFILRFSGRL